MAGCREHLVSATTGDETHFFPVQCKCWSCANCAPWLREKLANRIVSGKPTAFLTLTYRERSEGTKDEHARELVDAWAIVRKRINRWLAPAVLEFAAVMEKQKNGEPHIHLALSGQFIPQRLLSKWMHELIDSHRVWIKEITDPIDAAGYLTKYMTKDPNRFKGCKRFWFSRGYEPEKVDDEETRQQPDSSERWQHATFADIKEAALILGFDVTSTSSAKLTVRTSDTKKIRRYLERLAAPRALSHQERGFRHMDVHGQSP
jgi:hypothetical protein